MISDRFLSSEAETQQAGRELAAAIRQSGAGCLVCYLQGELGAGKTTLTRGLLREFGHEGRVPSPTYTLVEPYDIDGYQITHVDLYRLPEPAEAEDLALAECIEGRAGPGIMLIEWPEHGAGFIPAADLIVALALDGEGRRLEVAALTEQGNRVLAHRNK